MILLWGVTDDPPLAAVQRAMERRGANYLLLDQRQAPADYAFRFGAVVEGRLGGVDLARVSSAYVRPQDVVDDDRARRLEALLASWLELSPIPVLNRFSAQASNTSKLLQARLIQAQGFAVPPSLATTDPRAARAFVARHGAVIYKSLSSVRSIVRRLKPCELGRLDAVVSCPTQFQRYIPGVDYRVHVVDGQAFGVRIDSHSDDYRYDAGAGLAPADLPPDLQARCVALARALGLRLAGIDLRLDPDGAWHCFEVNPSPGFSCFEPEGDEPIATAVADLLIAAPALPSSARCPPGRSW